MLKQLSILICFTLYTAIAQATTTTTITTNIHNIIESRINATDTTATSTTEHKIQCSELSTCNSNLTIKYYRAHNFYPIWFNKHGELSKVGYNLIKILSTSNEDGLDPKKYHLDEINTLIQALPQKQSNAHSIASSGDTVESTNAAPINPKIAASDSHLANPAANSETTLDTKTLETIGNLDMLLTDALFLYADNLHYGVVDYAKKFPYWHTHPSKVDLIQVLNKAIQYDNLKVILNNLAPKYSGYTKLKHLLAVYQGIAKNNPWQPIDSGDLQPGDHGGSVRLLQQHLFITGELAESIASGNFDDVTETAVMRFQDNMGLLDSGIVDADTRAALNVPVEERIQQIEANMDIMRSFPSNLGAQHLLVNIPAYSLTLINDNKKVFVMDVAVGSSTHQSCILKSAITNVVINPAWYVPSSIAESEVFPLLQAGSDYLTTHNIVVARNIGNGRTRIVDPKKTNWKTMTLEQFHDNYSFTQKPGSDNVLGKVKFIFANPCEIYLHDSIESEVFDTSERNVSHGCIRLGKPLLLNSFLLGKINNMPESSIANLFKTDHNKSTKLAHPVLLYIVYLSSWVNNDGVLQFRNDIYNLLDLKNYAQ